MNLLATSGLTEVLLAIAIGAIVSVAASVAVALITVRQRRQIADLARASLSLEAVKLATSLAEGKDSGLIHQVLESAVADVAADQQLSMRLVRAALIANLPDSPRVLKHQTVNFDQLPVELSRIQNDAALRAAESGKPVISLQSLQEESAAAEPVERGQIDPLPQWVISMPVGQAGGQDAWVMSVEGLVERRAADNLLSSVGRLLYYAEMLDLFRKDRGKKTE
ncbi:MAG: hypothetical protein QOE83_27 [Actinomycetota bacterium]|jgi:hypothetical protein|nr:hypothetical protein [Actinomycetota bacterium]